MRQDAACFAYAQANEFLAPIEVVGRAGRRLREEWKDGAESVDFSAETFSKGYEVGAKVHKDNLRGDIDVRVDQFLRDFESCNSIPVEPVYSGKMFYGLYRMLQENKLAAGSRVVAIHTGGLQGLRGMQDTLLKLLS